jgi:hypothetical protein
MRTGKKGPEEVNPKLRILHTLFWGRSIFSRQYWLWIFQGRNKRELPPYLPPEKKQGQTDEDHRLIDLDRYEKEYQDTDRAMDELRGNKKKRIGYE